MTTQVSRESFGTLDDGTRVDRWTLESGPGGLRVRLLTYGGIIQTVEAPDRDGTRGQLALGFADLASYAAHGGSYFGALVGRYANRIAGASFTLDGEARTLTPNDGRHSLHGGPGDSPGWCGRPVRSTGACSCTGSARRVRKASPAPWTSA